jgi:deoxyxylulose-5-phosphate synthase
MEAIGRPVIKMGLASEFIPHGKRERLLENYGLTPKGIADKIKAVITLRDLNTSSPITL